DGIPLRVLAFLAHPFTAAPAVAVAWGHAAIPALTGNAIAAAIDVAFRSVTHLVEAGRGAWRRDEPRGDCERDTGAPRQHAASNLSATRRARKSAKRHWGMTRRPFEGPRPGRVAD